MSYCRCGHDQKHHVQTLFGMKCEGRDWMDERSFECHCAEFAPATSPAPAPDAAPWLGGGDE